MRKQLLWKHVTNSLTKLDELRCSISDKSSDEISLAQKWLLQTIHMFTLFPLQFTMLSQDVTNSSIFFSNVFYFLSFTHKRSNGSMLQIEWYLSTNMRFARLKCTRRRCCVHHSRSISVFVNQIASHPFHSIWPFQSGATPNRILYQTKTSDSNVCICVCLTNTYGIKLGYS